MLNNKFWRFLDLGVTDPYESYIIQEVLQKAMKRKIIPNTLYCCIPKKHVWIGPKTNMNKQVNLEYCRKEKITIMRGSLGGKGVGVLGTTIHYGLASNPTVNGVPLNLTLCMQCVAKGLQFMGLDAKIRPQSNDILVNGQKISGNASTLSNGFFFFTGGVVVDFDFNFCEQAISPIPELFANKEAKSHREWITSLKIQFRREVLYSEVISTIKKGFENILQVEFEVINSLSDVELEILEGLQEKYRSDEWLKFGRWSPVKDYWRPK